MLHETMEVKRTNKAKYFLIGIISILLMLSTVVSSVSVINNNISEKQRATLVDQEAGIEIRLDPLIIHITNNSAPSKPVITGPTNGTVGVKYEWSYFSIDPDGDNITYYIDWGDVCGGGKYFGPYPSGTELVLSHIYSNKATLLILSVAIDEHGAESEPTYFEVTIPKNIIVKNSFFLQLLERLLIVLPMLKNLL